MIKHVLAATMFLLSLAPAAFAQAVSTYERNGRIYKLAHGKDVIPIYNGVPVSQKNRLVCDWGYMKTAYYTKTLDNKRCVISYRCTPSGIGPSR